MSRLAVGAMLVAVAGALAPPAAAATNCSFNLLGRTVSVEVQGDPDPTDEGLATIARDGDLITVNGSTCTLLAGLIPATVHNTDEITVTGSDSGHERVVLQPGLASADILVNVDFAENPSTASQRVLLIGTDGPDAMTVADLGADQDGDGDVDVTITETTETPAWQPTTGAGNDIVTGQGAAGTGQPTEVQMVIVGGPGDDTLTGGASPGADYFFGGPGDDTLDGGDVPGQVGGVSDTARYDDAPVGVTVNLATGIANVGDDVDTLVGIEYALGSMYNDELLGDEGNNAFEGLGGCDTIDGRGGTLNRVSYNNSPGPVEVDLRVQSAITPECDLETFSNIQGVVGSHHDDTIIGDDGPNNLQGLSGIDILIGLDGDDSLFGQDGSDAMGGGAGDDIIWPGPGDDIAHGGTGVDRLSYADIGAGVEVNLLFQTTGQAAGSDSVAAFENIQGSQFNDTLTGDEGPNVLWGLGGDDTLDGGDGDDICDPAPGNDPLPVNCEG